MPAPLRRKPLNGFWRPDLVAGLLIVLIVTGSLIPADEARAVPGNDFIKHAGLYGLLCFMMLAAWGKSAAAAAILMIAVVMLGLSLEVLQPLVGRAFDIKDIMYNSIGVVGGAVCMLVFGTWKSFPPR